MKYFLRLQSKMFTLFLLLFTVFGYSQSRDVRHINKNVTVKNAFEPFYYLASDSLKGRNTKRPEIHLAAQFIGDYFKKYGVQPIAGNTGYFQKFELKRIVPAKHGVLQVMDSSFEVGKDLLQLRGFDVSLHVPIVYVGFANPEDLAKVEIAGKIVLTNLGTSDSSTFSEGLANITQKRQLLKQKGALAIIERCWHTFVPWDLLQNYLGGERFVQTEDSLPVFLLRDCPALLSALTNAPPASLTSTGNEMSVLAAKNVSGVVPGTDSQLNKEYIMLSAHYDHLGVKEPAQEAIEHSDSIYNGARDNAIGVSAVMNAARYFAQNPPKRSVLFLLFTGEELGLLGSYYFSENPSVPLNKIVYNLNCDNGSYNDTTIVTVFGLGRTSADQDIKKATSSYGITAIADPVPELNLFDRSDNVNFAVKGIPSPTFSMGLTAFDSVVMKYYHQLGDEIGSFDLNYGLTYIRSYILAAKNIADNPMQPAWIKGDKYEAAWKQLYNR